RELLTKRRRTFQSGGCLSARREHSRTIESTHGGVQGQRLPRKRSECTQWHLTPALETSQQRALSRAGKPRRRIIQSSQPLQRVGIVRTSTHSNDAVGDRRSEDLRRQMLGDVSFEAQSAKARSSQNDRVVVAFAEPLDARRNITSQLQLLNVRTCAC